MNFDNIWQQAKKAEEVFKQAEAQLKSLQIQGEAGAGMVVVTMNGCYDVLNVKIEIADANKAVLEELVAAAIRDAIEKVKRASQEKMSGAMGAFGLPAGLMSWLRFGK